MKRILTILALAVALPCLAADTNVTAAGNAFLSGAITNISLDLHGVYAPQSTTGSKYGGGGDVFYNLTVDNNTGFTIGPGVGAQWLGQWETFSGQVQFKLPTHPLKFLGGFATNIVFTPIAVVGAMTSISGPSFTAVVAGGGGAIDLVNIGGFELSAGLVVNHWSGSKNQDGLHYVPGIALHRPF